MQIVAPLLPSLAVHTVSAVTSHQGQQVTHPNSHSHKATPIQMDSRKTHTIARNMAIPAHHTMRQAIQSPTAAQFIFLAWVTDLILCFIQHRLDSAQQVFPGWLTSGSHRKIAQHEMQATSSFRLLLAFWTIGDNRRPDSRLQLAPTTCGVVEPIAPLGRAVSPSRRRRSAERSHVARSKRQGSA